MTTFFLLAAGLAVLTAGAEMLVKGASRIALAAGISPLAVGLTIVAYGTSTPELVVSMQAAWAGQADIALGNAVGSNIFNILFILGISALIAPLVVTRKLVRIDVPIMIAVSLLLWVLALDGRIGRADAVLLTAGIVLFTVFSILQGRKEEAASKSGDSSASESSGENTGRKSWIFNLLLTAAGLAGLAFGAKWFLEGAVTLARGLGVSELVIGLTLVAAGTSLPEVATSILATLRGQRDIAIGNVVGSNIYNILAILGLTAFVPEGGLSVAPSMIHFDIPFMTAVAFACLPIFFSGHRIDRWEGALFLLYYVLFTFFLYLKSVQHEALPMFSSVMFLFVAPLTAVTLAVVLIRQRSRTLQKD